MDIEALIEIAIEQELAESIQDVTEGEIARLEAEDQAEQSTTLILF